MTITLYIQFGEQIERVIGKTPAATKADSPFTCIADRSPNTTIDKIFSASASASDSSSIPTASRYAFESATATNKRALLCAFERGV